MGWAPRRPARGSFATTKFSTGLPVTRSFTGRRGSHPLPRRPRTTLLDGWTVGGVERRAPLGSREHRSDPATLLLVAISRHDAPAWPLLARRGKGRASAGAGGVRSGRLGHR